LRRNPSTDLIDAFSESRPIFRPSRFAAVIRRDGKPAEQHADLLFDHPNLDGPGPREETGWETRVSSLQPIPEILAVHLVSLKQCPDMATRLIEQFVEIKIESDVSDLAVHNQIFGKSR
jgi:hypothetical protein